MSINLIFFIENAIYSKILFVIYQLSLHSANEMDKEEMSFWFAFHRKCRKFRL